MSQSKIPVTYMRGGTSKGVFFRADSLPTDPRSRDAILLRVMGSPDPYLTQIDGMGSATSTTSKVAIVSPSGRPDSDVDYLFGQVPLNRATIDWSGSCGNLTAAVGLFAVAQGMVAAPHDGSATVRIWQVNTATKIIVHVPMNDGQVVEDGDHVIAGVSFPAAEIRIDFLNPGKQDEPGATFPTGNTIDWLEVPEHGEFAVTLINAGNPTIFIRAEDLNLTGAELPSEVNGDQQLLAKCEAIRAHAAVRMGLVATAQEATGSRPHTPKLAFVSPPLVYMASNGDRVVPEQIDLNARILSMGQLHHAMTGTGGVAIAVAAAVTGTVVSSLLDGGSPPEQIRFGHPSGTMAVGAIAEEVEGNWVVSKVTLSRSARRIMEGHVLVPSKLLKNNVGNNKFANITSTNFF